MPTSREDHAVDLVARPIEASEAMKAIEVVR